VWIDISYEYGLLILNSGSAVKERGCLKKDGPQEAWFFAFSMEKRWSPCMSPASYVCLVFCIPVVGFDKRSWFFALCFSYLAALADVLFLDDKLC
jgi:hypothetical protein